MINTDKQSNPDVFEMILQAVGDATPLVQAERKAVPAGEVWQPPQEEGQLAVDVADAGRELIVISTMAGAEAGKIEVYLHNDLLTIRGERQRPVRSSESLDYLHTECFWGPFSRTIVLPVEVQPHRARAEYKNGVLLVSIPKRQVDARIPVVVVEE